MLRLNGRHPADSHLLCCCVNGGGEVFVNTVGTFGRPPTTGAGWQRRLGAQRSTVGRSSTRWNILLADLEVGGPAFSWSRSQEEPQRTGWDSSSCCANTHSWPVRCKSSGRSSDHCMRGVWNVKGTHGMFSGRTELGLEPIRTHDRTQWKSLGSDGNQDRSRSPWFSEEVTLWIWKKDKEATAMLLAIRSFFLATLSSNGDAWVGDCA